MRAVRGFGILVLMVGGIVGIASPVQAASGPWLTVAAGSAHTCAVNTAGSLYCWGLNDSGQVGDGLTDSPHLSLARVGAAGAWVRVAAGDGFSCGITKAKNLYCWGNNNGGQIGDGYTANPHPALFRVGASGVWSSVTAGVYHTCGITTARNLYCWGANGFGQVGDGQTDNPHLALYRVGAAGVWSSVTAGAWHTCGITTAKNLYCWGADDEAQIGNGTTSTSHVGLFRVGAAGVWASVTAGARHTCAITTAKNLYCWGFNSQGQVGDGTQTDPRKTLYRVGAAGVWSSVTGGGTHTCGITTAKNLYCWGYNTYGQVGDAQQENPRLSLYRVGSAGVWTRAAGGLNHTCGTQSSGDLWCWGANFAGQVGDGTTNSPRLSLFRVT